MTWLSSFLLAPTLAVIGAVAIASPIIIHLLNKRRFKIVDWAAMEFLLDADKKNRRRVRLENLILLLLRCLALFLLGLLLARPFAENLLTSRFVESPTYERIVLLDDSLSMSAKTGKTTSLEEAKDSLQSIAQAFAENQSDDLLTVYLTSQPKSPLVNGKRITDKSIKEIEAEVRNIQPSDKSANLSLALLEIEQGVSGEKKNVNRVVYIMTDLRERDWQGDENTGNKNHPTNIINRLSKDTSGCFLVDVGSDEKANVAITEIRPEDILISGVSSRFDVTVSNLGSETVEELTVKFIVGNVGDTLPLEQQVTRIEPGKSETVQFNTTFTNEDLIDLDFDEDSAANRHKMNSIRIMAQVVSSNPDRQDLLVADSERFFAARVVRGIPTLIVDGEPSPRRMFSESYYLERALEPPGDHLSGVVADVVTDTELETTTLSKYKVIILCNFVCVDESVLDESDDGKTAGQPRARYDRRIERLEKWVRDGGKLVIMPGHAVDADDYNDMVYKNGNGLSPFRLNRLHGIENKWSNIHVVDSNHPALGVFAGQDNPLLGRVKVMNWWGASLPEDASNVSVIARLTDIDDSLLMAEKPLGNGRILATTIPADREWTNWPDDPSYLIAMNELVRHMAGNLVGSGDLRVGEPLRFALDLVEYEESAELTLPIENELPVTVQAVERQDESTDEARPGDGEQDPPTATNTVWQVDYRGVRRRGFYELNLARNSGGNEGVLFAANVDPAESDLRRLAAVGRQKLTSESVKIVSSSQAAAQAVRGLRKELWKILFYAVVIALCVEQFLGWYFGTKR